MYQLSHRLERHGDGVYSIDERMTLQTMADIGGNFQRYGEHPHCAGCGEKCRQPNVPGAVIVFCPRMREE